MMKSLIWTSVFFLLMLELIVTIVLVIPVPRNIRNFIAKRVSKLKLGAKISKVTLYLVIGLSIALTESIVTLNGLEKKINERKLEHHGEVSLREEAMFNEHDKKRIFKAQRNMYLAGFALTLLFVIGRIAQLMQESVELEEEVRRLSKASDPPASAPVEGDNIEMKPMKQKKKD